MEAQLLAVRARNCFPLMPAKAGIQFLLSRFSAGSPLEPALGPAKLDPGAGTSGTNGRLS